MAQRRYRKRVGRTKLPKGAYRLPTGGHMMDSAHTSITRGKRSIRVVGVYRDQPDTRRLARALLELGKQIVADQNTTKPKS